MTQQDRNDLDETGDVFDLGEATEQTEGLPNWPIAEAGSVMRTMA